MNQKQTLVQQTDDEDEIVILQFIPDEQSDSDIETNFQKVPELNKIDVKVTGYTLESSYLKQTHYFTILSSIINEQQVRTNYDFNWFIKRIQNKYPGIGIPIDILQNSQYKSEQKIIVIDQFVKYICNHEKLKYSPQVRYFFGNKIQFLEQKNKEFRIGVNTEKQLKQIITQIISPTNNLSSIQNIDLQKLLQREQEIRDYSVMLKNILDYKKQKSDTKIKSLKNQKLIFSKSMSLPFLNNQLKKIQQQVNLFHQKYIKQLDDQYLHKTIYIKIVYENLINYLRMFNRMKNLCIKISNQKQQKIKQYRQYLRLFKNNMNNDIKIWLEYNNNLINSKFS